MTSLYYYSGIIFIIAQLVIIKDPITFYKGVNELRKRRNFEQYTPNMRSYVFVGLLFLFWSMLGLFSSQYVCFIAILVLSFIPRKHWIITLICSALTLCLLLFIILNYAHWHIDVEQLLLKAISQ